jgi:rare lipoprotein A
VGAFSQQTNAGELRGRLEDAGLTPVLVAAAPAGSAPLYRVRIGPIANVAESDRLAGRLRALGFPEGRAVVE